MSCFYLAEATKSAFKQVVYASQDSTGIIVPSALTSSYIPSYAVPKQASVLQMPFDPTIKENTRVAGMHTTRKQGEFLESKEAKRQKKAPSVQPHSQSKSAFKQVVYMSQDSTGIMVPSAPASSYISSSAVSKQVSVLQMPCPDVTIEENTRAAGVCTTRKQDNLLKSKDAKRQKKAPSARSHSRSNSDALKKQEIGNKHAKSTSKITAVATITPRELEVKGKRRGRGRVAGVRSCVNCYFAKTKCKGGRPCERCVRLRRGDSCVDRLRLPRGGTCPFAKQNIFMTSPYSSMCSYWY